MDAASRNRDQDSAAADLGVDLREEDMDKRTSKQPLTEIEQQYEALPDTIPRRIHILGTGSIGKLVAHSLRSLPDPPPVTLLFHRYKLLEAWNNGPKEITINRDGFDLKETGFDVELPREVRRQHGTIVEQKDEGMFDGSVKRHETAQALAADQAGSQTSGAQLRQGQRYKRTTNDIIDHLVVTTKTFLTVPAILPIKHRIRPSSTICLLQNGMGVIDELNEKVFPDPSTRPKYIQGVITHGVNVPPEVAHHDPFYAVHAGQGTMALGLLSPEPHNKINYSRYLLRTLTRSPVLVAVTQTQTELLQLQLEKLAVNCILNPLTVLMDARNGCILDNFAITRTMRLMLAEISLVIRSLPELRGLPNVANRFSAQRLETVVLSVATTTAQNISSMLADVRGGRKTEVEFINGYIIKRGEELGIKCVVNYGIMNTVIGKANMTREELRSEIPIDSRVDLNQGL